MLRWIAVFLIFALCATAVQAQTGRKLLLMGNNCPLQLGVRSAPQCPTVVVPNNTVYQTDVASTSGLVGYWKMEDNAGCSTLADTSSSNNTAIISGTVTCGSTALITGQAATSALFNGSTGRAQLGAGGGTTFNWEYTQPWTVEFLINPNSPRTGSAVNQEVWTKVGTSSPFRGIEIGLQYNGTVAAKNVVRVVVQGTSGDGIQTFGSTDLSNATVWHVVVSYTGTGTAAGVTIYVNGVADTKTTLSDSLAGTTIINATNPTIGAWGNGSQFFFNGNIQELAIYNVAVGQTTSTLTIATGLLTFGKPGQHYALAAGRVLLPRIYHPRVILDSDLASDIDDVGSVLMAMDFHKRGEISLVGVITSSANDRSADTAYAIGKQLINAPQGLVGAWQGAAPAGAPSASVYTASVSSTFGANQGRASYTDGIQKYRALLAAQPNQSVVIIGTGFSTALDGLLTSASNAGGDGLPSGPTLITQKVIRLVIGAGCYPTNASCPSGGAPEFNLVNGPSANASDVFANWPTDIVVVGIELAGTAGTNVGSVYSGPAAIVDTSTPINLAWNLWGSTPRTAWDPLTAWCAVRQDVGGCVQAGVRGTNTVNSSTGANAWTTPNPVTGAATYLKLSATNAAFRSQFDLSYSALPAPFQ